MTCFICLIPCWELAEPPLRMSGKYSSRFCLQSCHSWSTSFLLFSFAFLFLFPFCSSVPSEASVSQKLRCIMSNIVSINHCVRTQQVDLSLCFRRWWRSRLLSTFFSSFPWWTSTTLSASTSTFPRFPRFSRLVTCRLRELYTICYERIEKVNKPSGSHWNAQNHSSASVVTIRRRTHHFEGKIATPEDLAIDAFKWFSK